MYITSVGGSGGETIFNLNGAQEILRWNCENHTLCDEEIFSFPSMASAFVRLERDSFSGDDTDDLLLKRSPEAGGLTVKKKKKVVEEKFSRAQTVDAFIRVYTTLQSDCFEPIFLTITSSIGLYKIPVVISFVFRPIPEIHFLLMVPKQILAVFMATYFFFLRPTRYFVTLSVRFYPHCPFTPRLSYTWDEISPFRNPFLFFIFFYLFHQQRGTR